MTPQAADGVFSGGGIKGLAFAGAVTAAQEAGWVFTANLAGTSAGAICALALALGYDAAGLRKLFAQDLGFIDDPLPLGLPNYFGYGWVRGKGLARFIEQVIAEAPVKAATFGDLPAGKLRVIGTDLVHERMVVFPDDAGLYLDPANGKPFTPETLPLNTAVRISAGYPGFFPPIVLKDAATGRDGALVDGGVCSSFPVWLFDDPKPTRPTWGFNLYDGGPPTSTPTHPISGLLWPVDMLETVIATAVGALDTLEAKRFGNRIIQIPTGAISALDFSPTAEQKQALYDGGYQAAKQFFASNPTPTNTFGKTPVPGGTQ
jgi:NTE family protein